MVQRLKILYINLNHLKKASDALLVVAAEKLVDIVAITEPYAPRGRISAPGWQQFCQGRTGLWIRRGIKELQLSTDFAEAIMVQISSLTLAVAYFSPAKHIDGPLRTFSQDLAQADGPLLLLGDFNCRTSLIPGNQTDCRGKLFEDLIATEADIWIPNAPTWTGPNGLSGYNNSVCYRQLNVECAEVLTDQPSNSNHRYIKIDIRATFPKFREERKLLKDEVQCRLQTLHLCLPENLQTQEDIDQYVDYLTREPQTVIEASTAPIRRNRKPV